MNTSKDFLKTDSEPSLPTIDDVTRRWLIEKKKENKRISEGARLFSEDRDRNSPRHIAECRSKIDSRRLRKKPICSSPDGIYEETSRFDIDEDYRTSARRSKASASSSKSYKYRKRERSRSLSASFNSSHEYRHRSNKSSRRSSTAKTKLSVPRREEMVRLCRTPMVSHSTDEGHRASSPCHDRRRTSSRKSTKSATFEQSHHASSSCRDRQRTSSCKSTESPRLEEGNQAPPPCEKRWRTSSFKPTRSPTCEKRIDLVVIGFGEPGTGKTYTMSGLNKTHAERGLIPRALEEIYLMKGWRTEVNVKIGVTYVEFTENKCYNLLGPKRMEISLEKIKPIKVANMVEALDLLFRGEPKRKFEKQGSNCGSSVYTIHVESMSVNLSETNILSSKIHFVDTAGIETIWKSNKSEICAISSNMEKYSVDRTSRWAYYLAKSIEKPSKNKNYPAVYGTSNLIKYLDRSFTHGFVTLLGFIKPKGEELRLTLSTLRFGCKVARLHCGSLETHKRPSSSRVTAELKDEIDELRAQIETSKLMRLGEYNHWNVCQGEAQHIERLIKSYLKTSYTDRVTESCLLSTARPSLLLEEMRRQYQDERLFITTNFPLKVVQPELLQSISELPLGVGKSKKGFGKSKKRYSGGTINEVSSLKDVTDVADDTKSVGVKSNKSAQKSTSGSKRKSKSLGSRKSVAAKKSKAGSAKRKTTGTKVPEPPAIDAEFLDKGKRDKTWLLEQFLLRNKDLAEEKRTTDTAFAAAREAKISKAKELDALRASLGTTRIQLNDVQWRRNYTLVVPPVAVLAADENEQTLIAEEKEIRAKITKASEELAMLHGALIDITSVYNGLEARLQKLFTVWCRELYCVEILEEEIGNVTASMQDREVPRQTLIPSVGLETEPELEFVKMQESHFSKKLPVRPIQRDNP